VSSTHAAHATTGWPAVDPEPHGVAVVTAPTLVILREPAPKPAWPWWILVSLALMVCAIWAVAIWAAAHVHAAHGLRTAALFAHLACLVLGFGAVLTLDAYAALWLLGRRTLSEVLRVAGGVHLLVWAGLTGLVLSGVFLRPDLDSPFTQLKLVLVLIVGLNGAHVLAIQRRLEASGDRRPPTRLVLRSGTAALISQAGWWGAMLIGFLNAQT
jgi:hypothetical protein